jgi:hypothetical protein
MRLGQLARKLSLRPSQIVDYLASNNIQTEEGSNTRLADEHTELIVQHFAPESLEEIMRPVPVVGEVPKAEVEPVERIVEEPVRVEVEQKAEEPVIVSEDKPSEDQSEPEVIRVQKIELSGLKVLGKIELPEPKKKEPKPEGEVSGEEQPKPERRSPAKSKHPRRESDQRNWRNPLEVQRQREAREIEERRRAEIDREKEKRKHHYQNKVKQVKQPKRSKPSKEVVTVKKTVDTRPVPKTWVGKFLRWWTT